MATSFFYIYVMFTSFFYVYVIATSFFYIYVEIYIDIFIDIYYDIYIDIYISFTNWRSAQSFYWTPFLVVSFDWIDLERSLCKKLYKYHYLK